jgi:hypothetical protein
MIEVIPLTLMTIENPPLWIWAVIAGVIVGGKLVYRWYALKHFARESQRKKVRK